MAEVGVRALRDHLSRYLERVQAGEELVVTDRGRGIARLVPIDGVRAIDRLIADGLVTPAQTVRRRPTPMRTSGVVSDLIATSDRDRLLRHVGHRPARHRRARHGCRRVGCGMRPIVS